MGFKSDIEIAQECVMQPITKIAEKAGQISGAVRKIQSKD